MTNSNIEIIYEGIRHLMFGVHVWISKWSEQGRSACCMKASSLTCALKPPARSVLKDTWHLPSTGNGKWKPQAALVCLHSPSAGKGVQTYLHCCLLLSSLLFNAAAFFRAISSCVHLICWGWGDGLGDGSEGVFWLPNWAASKYKIQQKAVS